ncbi:MAG: hypothetical protein PHX70_11095 [Clostridium sp.]|nr:hypothetical protein [Clostridium sp.]
MHDTLLLNKISEELDKYCSETKISKLTKIIINVNKSSHINAQNIAQYLKSYNKDTVDSFTNIQVEIEELPDQIAIIKRVEGEMAD